METEDKTQEIRNFSDRELEEMYQRHIKKKREAYASCKKDAGELVGASALYAVITGLASYNFSSGVAITSLAVGGAFSLTAAVIGAFAIRDSLKLRRELKRNLALELQL